MQSDKRVRHSRNDRIEELIKRELSELLNRRAGDPRVQAATVLGVEMTPDRKTARVRVCKSITGEYREPKKSEQKELVEGLTSASPYLMEQVKRRTSLKFVPWMNFEYDESLSDTARVFQILSKLRESEKS